MTMSPLDYYHNANQTYKQYADRYPLPIYKFPNGDLCVVNRHAGLTSLAENGLAYIQQLPIIKIKLSDSSKLDLTGNGFVKINENEWEAPNGATFDIPLIELNPFSNDAMVFFNAQLQTHSLFSIFDTISPQAFNMQAGNKYVLKHTFEVFPQKFETDWYFRWGIKSGTLPESITWENFVIPTLGYGDFRSFSARRIATVLFDGYRGRCCEAEGTEKTVIVVEAVRHFWSYVAKCVETKQKISEQEFMDWVNWLERVSMSFNSCHQDTLKDIHLFPPDSLTKNPKPKQLCLFW